MTFCHFPPLKVSPKGSKQKRAWWLVPLKLFFAWVYPMGKKEGEVTLRPALADTHRTDVGSQGRNISLNGQLTGRAISEAAQTCSPPAKSHNRNAANMKSKCEFRDLN